VSDEGVRHKKNPPFSEAGFKYFVSFIYTNVPPPFSAGKIMTTTIIIAAIEKVTLFTLLFNMKGYCTANILPPILKTKNFFA